MTHQEAVDRIREIAKTLEGDPDWALKYESASYYRDGYKIEAYIQSVGFGEGQTYQEAIEHLKAVVRNFGDTQAPPEDDGE